MAFSSYTPLQSYPADGVQTDFNAPDLFYDPADVRCVIVDNGNEIPQVQGVDYTVILTGRELTPPFRNTGLVRFVVPPLAGQKVVPFILPPTIQDQPFEGRSVTPRQHERVHDRAVQSIAMLMEFFNRSYRSPLDTPAALRFIAAGGAGRVPIWDDEGNLIEGPTAAELIAAAAVATSAAEIAVAAANLVNQYADELVALPTVLQAAIDAKNASIAAAEASGDVEFFDTYAEANAAVGSLEDGQVVEVFADETHGSQRYRYRVEAGALVPKLGFFSLVSVKDPGFAAKGDGVTDDTVAINAAIDAVHAAGGGVVFVPAGSYITTDNITVKDGVYLLGAGYGSHIHNTATSGFAKCTVVTSNIGDIDGGGSLYTETKYDIEPALAGAMNVEFVDPADAATFVVGDIVGIGSYELWALPSPDDHEKYVNLNEVVGISGAVVSLRYPLLDDYPATSGNPTIRRLTGTLDGYDGNPGFMSKNCGVSNLRLTQETGLLSGWYSIFASGINQKIERLWMDNCSGMVGSNGLAHSTIRDIEGSYETRFLDICDWQTEVLVENVNGAKFAVNEALPVLGLGINNGSNVTVRNVTVDLGGYGRASMFLVHRGVFENVNVLNAGSDDALLLGYGDDCEAFRCRVVNPHKNGVVLAGQRSRVHACSIPSVGSGGYSVLALPAVDVCYVHDNEFGVSGAETPNDRFYQAVPSANIEVHGNTGYVEKLSKVGRVNWAGFAQTSDTAFAVLKTTSLKGMTGVTRTYKITASGIRSGTADTKDVKLCLGTTTLASVAYLAADNQTWEMSAIIIARADADSVQSQGRGYKGTTMVYGAWQAIASGLLADTTISVQGKVTNAADAIYCTMFSVEPVI